MGSRDPQRADKSAERFGARANIAAKENVLRFIRRGAPKIRATMNQKGKPLVEDHIQLGMGP